MSTTLATPAAPESVDLDMGGLDNALAAFNPANPTAPVEQPKPADPTPTPDAPAEAAKPADAKPADEKPKKGLDALPGEEVAEKKEEAKKEEPAAEEVEVDTSKWAKPQQQAFAAMRAETKRAKEQAKDAQIRYEKLQKEHEAFKATPRDSEELVKKVERLEAKERAYDLKNTDDWQKGVVAPIHERYASLKSTAETAGIDGDDLINAADAATPFARAQAVRAIFKKLDAASEEPIPADLISDVILAVEGEAKELHLLYQKGRKMEQDSEQSLLSMKHESEQQKAAAAKAEEAAYLKHHDHIYGQMAAKLPSIFSNPEVAEEIKSARPATDPADKAFQAQAAAALPTIVKELLAAREEVKKERAAKLALLNTRPGVTPSSAVVQKQPSADDVELDEDGLTAALRGVKA